MSRYAPSDYRGPPRDRSRSPPRFSDRRPSATSVFDNRPSGPIRAATDAPRGLRPAYDGARNPVAGALGSSSAGRSGFPSLRDAPPLGSGDRGRPYREREYDRRDRPPSPRDRSPPRTFQDSRDHLPRDLDSARTRRNSRDGPLPPGSIYPDAPPFAPSTSVRGGFSRGRGRGEFSHRGARGGGRGATDERDLFRRERSPAAKWTRENSRDDREVERRPIVRSDRERERDREPDRGRPPQGPPPRLDARGSTEVASGPPQQSSQAPSINPARLAMIESAGADASIRRASIQQDVPPQREVKADQLDTPAYLSGRAETTANRYGSRGSSPPTHAPPSVPAFTMPFTITTSGSASSAQPSSRALASNSTAQTVEAASVSRSPARSISASVTRTEPHQPARNAPKAPPPAPRAHLVSPPLAAPKGPRALEPAEPSGATSRVHGVKSMESLTTPNATTQNSRFDAGHLFVQQASTSEAGGYTASMTGPNQTISPNPPGNPRFTDIVAPAGPRAAHRSSVQPPVSPHPPFVSPRTDVGSFPAATSLRRMRTPPPTAPLGPRNRSFSGSPKVANPAVPTAPRGARGPPSAPRGQERIAPVNSRVPERPIVASARVPPNAPRAPQWNQWLRSGLPPAAGDHIVPAKRDFAGEARDKFAPQSSSNTAGTAPAAGSGRSEARPSIMSNLAHHSREDHVMDLDEPTAKHASNAVGAQSAARSFFGKSNDDEDEETGVSDLGQEPLSTSEDEESDLENDLALRRAKFEKQKRHLEAQMVDLSSRHYRATTPLEAVARLSRISSLDLQRVLENREQDVSMRDLSSLQEDQLQASATHSSDSGDQPDVLTPQEHENRNIAIRSSDESSGSVQRIRSPSPEPVSLPYLLKGGQASLFDDELSQGILQSSDGSISDLFVALREDLKMEYDSVREGENGFSDAYQMWREECEELDRIREEEELLERRQSTEPRIEVDAPATAPITPMYEGRRVHKFSSEYEIEQVLKQSEETARIEQERQDREMKKNRADMEKEAMLPNQLTVEAVNQGLFIDTNRLRTPDSLISVFCYEPPTDDFTANEQAVFIAAYKESPKKWGQIASLLPGRTYTDCIQHYYANKWDGRFRLHKKLKYSSRRGRGGHRAPRGRVGGLMADLVTRPEDAVSAEMSEKGRPRRAAAPTNFAEKVAEEAKATQFGPSPVKKAPAGAKVELHGDIGSEKPVKRRKGNGDKTSRKSKAVQPLAALAAAPQVSPNKQATLPVPSTEELLQAQKLQDATLLANLHVPRQGIMNTDAQVLYAQESYVPQIQLADDGDRSKALAAGPTVKQGASSYWSVPEVNDFNKYIGHFGRDFAAIAAHMGTKTQTMIKNHFQRQVDGGNRPDLVSSADEADQRRSRGEDMGPPPVPTPIVKRKYDQPQTGTQRPLTSQGDAMEVEDGVQVPRTQALKHGSPSQHQPQPRFTTSAQNTPISATRVMASPLVAATAAAPTAAQLATTAQSRPMPHPLGSRIAFSSDTQPESRPSMHTISSFRAPQDLPTRDQTLQPSRSALDAPDTQYLQNLRQERERALRIQDRIQEQNNKEQERVEQIQRPVTQVRNLSQGSPLNQPLYHPPKRSMPTEKRAPSPPRSTFLTSSFSRPLLGSTTFGQLAPPPSSLASRSTFQPSQAKREDFRPSSVQSPPIPPSASAPPSEPRRSTVMSLLNSEPEEVKPPKRDSLPSAHSRTISPAQQMLPPTTSATPLSALSAMGRPSFGQPSFPQSQLQRSPYEQPSAALETHSVAPKPEAAAYSHGGKPPDWTAGLLRQPNRPHSPQTVFTREVRPYFNHSSAIGTLDQQRSNASTPPISASNHSRHQSLTGQSAPQLREPTRLGMLGSQHALSHQSGQILQPNPYGGQQSLPFSQQHQQQPQQQSQQQQQSHAQSHAHHAHNNSHSSPFPVVHQRALSRDDRARHEQEQRNRDEQEMRMRQRQVIEAEKQRREQEYQAQRQQQDQERERRESHQRNSAHPPPLQPPTYNGPSFAHGRSLDLRSQSRMETEMAIRDEEQRQREQHEGDRRRQEAMMRDREADEYRRRQADALLQKRTPLGGGFGISPPQPPRR